MDDVDTRVPKKRSRRSAGAADKVAAKEVKTGKAHGTKQSYLGDMGPLRNKDIDAQGQEFINAMDQRKIWMERAHEFREAIIALMVKHKIDNYLLEVDTRTYRLEICQETKVSAKKLKVMPDEG